MAVTDMIYNPDDGQSGGTTGIVIVRTTKAGPQGQVHPARNFISLKGRPWSTHARRNLQLARPIDSHAI